MGETHHHISMVNRHPNVTCDLCGKPMYRRPNTLAKNAGKYCSTACRNKIYKSPTGPRGPNPKLAMENNPAWNGGSYVEPDKGYRMILKRDHPRARANGYVLEHILVAEKMMGRPLATGEEVHHKDRNKVNNDPGNLVVYKSHLEHWMMEHHAEVVSAAAAVNSKKNLKGGHTEPKV